MGVMSSIFINVRKQCFPPCRAILTLTSYHQLLTSTGYTANVLQTSNTKNTGLSLATVMLSGPTSYMDGTLKI